MALAFPATNTTASTAIGATHLGNLPSGISAGNLICLAYRSSSTSRYLLAPAGWDGEFHSAPDVGTIGLVYKQASGSEGATETFSFNTGTASAASVSFLVTGYDTADEFNTDNYVFDSEASEDPWTVAASLLSGIANSDSNAILIGVTNSVKTISTQDSGLTLIDSNVTGKTVHVLRETSPGSSNSAYSNDMSGAEAWSEMLIEIKAAAAGGGIEILRRRIEGS